MGSWIERVRTTDRWVYDISGLANLQGFFRKNAGLIGYLFVLGILAYGTGLAQFFLSIDAEFHSQNFGAKVQWVGQGRWGMYVLSLLLLPDPVMPFIPMVLAVTGLVLGTLCVLHALSRERGAADYLAAPLAIACPVIYFSLYFNTLGYGIGIGYGLVGLGLLALSRWSWQGSLVAILSWAFAIGIYQAMAPVIATLFGFYVFAQIVSKENAWGLLDWVKKALVFLAVLVLAFLLYWAISTLAMRALDVQFDSYLSDFVRLPSGWEQWLRALRQTFNLALDYFTGSGKFYLYDLLSLKILFYFLLSACAFLLLVAVHRKLLLRGVALLAVLAAFLASVSLCLMGDGVMPPRTLLAIPWVLAGMVFVVARNSGYTVRFVLTILVAACFYHFAVANNRYAFSSYMQWKADRELSVLLLERLGKLWDRLPTKTVHMHYPVVLVGWRESFESPIFSRRDIIGASFLGYTMEGGNSHRMASLFFSMGVWDYRGSSVAEEVAVAEYAKNMPAWPRNGAVDVVDGIIVVKLSEHSPVQIDRICTNQPTNPVCPVP